MTAARNFAKSLQGLASIVGRLVESATEQKSAFLANDLPGIEASRLAQEELLAELDGAQSSCGGDFVRLKKSLYLPDGETIAGLTTGRPELADIAGLWRDLLADLGRLREITLTNRLLAARAAAFYRKVTFLMQPERQPQTYADTGYLRDKAGPVISRVV